MKLLATLISLAFLSCQTPSKEEVEEKKVSSTCEEKIGGIYDRMSESGFYLDPNSTIKIEDVACMSFFDETGSVGITVCSSSLVVPSEYVSRDLGMCVREDGVTIFLFELELESHPHSDT